MDKNNEAKRGLGTCHRTTRHGEKEWLQRQQVESVVYYM
jgi:hypothetical protein